MGSYVVFLLVPSIFISEKLYVNLANILSGHFKHTIKTD